MEKYCTPLEELRHAFTDVSRAEGYTLKLSEEIQDFASICAKIRYALVKANRDLPYNDIDIMRMNFGYINKKLLN